MKTAITTFNFAFLFLVISACQPPTKSDNTEDIAASTHNNANALDWSGSYIGTLPCADCAGIETRLTLHEDLSYLIQTTYLGKEDNAFEQEGSFSWNADGNTITLSKMVDGPRQYFVGENTLTQLDQEGNRITGDLAQKYVLIKTTASKGEVSLDRSITDTRWKLVELMGQQVDITVNNKEPFIMLSSADKRVQGNGGCNTIAGIYTFKEGNRVTFSQMISTRMACPNMEIESQLLNALETADNYSLNGNQLTLNKARMAPLARFEAVLSE
ncbi:copper resistance protein NlpE N-terminal domain-containing protein [Catalinimonas niigatensis]|uniref:copper resistance protein NlpE N-terminal domain-containing protein n=1 Tax=Catalinimonas niigatensis TaxID=1397264 RepID=UPI00266610FF|nr:copper resistance protein NlpE N-terminal domain-containing protein [Catalinimonas niigatensis]WPP51367.1 copper resistance protein NlpE N-terminal domain-containing protein [Catalinimonas niigatensis]